jgi:deoxyribodipyrimidine photo-lyase
MLTDRAHQSRQFTPSRVAGLARLAAFVPAAGRTYANQRNSDLGPDRRGNVSVLSPYLRHRLLREEEVLAAVLARHSLASAEKYVQEVFWRTYFKGHLETRPAIWSRYRAALEQQVAAVEAGGGLAKAYRAAVEGRTGIDCFDAWVEELLETGYLHNHTRMWLASIWIFTLRLPWELGADFTLRHFLDGDPASNTLSWRWVGGLHTRGKTYLARRDNIAAHTDGRFSPKGLASEAPALEEEPMPAARPLGPAPVRFPSARALLLLTEEDLHPESLDRADADIVGVVGASAAAERSPLPVAPDMLAFTAGALDDGLARAAAHFRTSASRLPALNTTTLHDAARAHGVDTIVTPHAPVGPAAEALAAATKSLQGKGIRLVQVRRDFDTMAWPHGTKGFFAMKERIPDLIAKLGIGAGETSGAQGMLL